MNCIIERKQTTITYPHEVLNKNLNGLSLKVYGVLRMKRKPSGYTILKEESIANYAGCSIRSVKEATDKLVAAGIIEKVKRSKDGKNIAHLYKFCKIDTKKFVLMPADGLEADLTHGQFSVYLALLKHSNTNGFCFPSISQLEKTSGVSAPTVISAVKKLKRLALLVKKQVIRTIGCFGHNNFFLNKKKKAAGAITPKPQSSSSKLSITDFFARVKAFLRKGVIKFLRNPTVTTKIRS